MTEGLQGKALRADWASRSARNAPAVTLIHSLAHSLIRMLICSFVHSHIAHLFVIGWFVRSCFLIGSAAAERSAGAGLQRLGPGGSQSCPGNLALHRVMGDHSPSQALRASRGGSGCGAGLCSDFDIALGPRRLGCSDVSRTLHHFHASTCDDRVQELLFVAASSWVPRQEPEPHRRLRLTRLSRLRHAGNTAVETYSRPRASATSERTWGLPKSWPRPAPTSHLCLFLVVQEQIPCPGKAGGRRAREGPGQANIFPVPAPGLSFLQSRVLGPLTSPPLQSCLDERPGLKPPLR